MKEGNPQQQIKDLVSVSAKMLRVKSVEEVCRLTAKAVVRFTKFKRSVVSILENDGTFARLGFGGLSDSEIEALKNTPRSTIEIINEHLVKKYKLSRSYFLPYVPEDAGEKRTRSEKDGWHSKDFLFVPLYNTDEKMVGLISVDDPSDGARPTEESLLPLELFATQIAALLENLRNLGKQQQMIRRMKSQQEVVLELSTPVMRILDKVLVLPLIGAVDSTRAQQILENVLLKISDTSSSVVIIDITGVPVIDTHVAAHLVKTVEASRLLGAKTIITGIKADISQTLVTLGVNLDQITTMSTLEAGIVEALNITGKRIIDVVKPVSHVKPEPD